MVNIGHLQKQNFKLLSMPKSSLTNLPEIDYAKVSKRLKDAVIEKNRKAERTGINVSQEAQALFDVLAN